MEILISGKAVCEDENGEGALTAIKVAQLCGESIKTGQVLYLNKWRQFSEY